MIYHPSFRELVISGELLVVLFPLRILLGFLTSEAEKERKRIIKQHVKQGHDLPFKHCSSEDCASIASETQSMSLEQL